MLQYTLPSTIELIILLCSMGRKCLLWYTMAKIFIMRQWLCTKSTRIYCVCVYVLWNNNFFPRPSHRKFNLSARLRLDHLYICVRVVDRKNTYKLTKFEMCQEIRLFSDMIMMLCMWNCSYIYDQIMYIIQYIYLEG